MTMMGMMGIISDRLVIDPPFPKTPPNQRGFFWGGCY